MSDDPLGPIALENWKVEVVGETLSTNALVTARAADGEPGGLAVIADHQVAGRGRRGNRWDAPAGSALLLSALLRPDAPVARWPRLAIAVALAVCRALEEKSTLRPLIKWPNDILVDGHKIAGILLESRSPDEHHGGWVVVGVGVNVHTRGFPVNLRYPATSIAMACGHAPPRAELAASLLAHLGTAARQAFSDWDNLLHEYSRRDALAGHQIRVESAQGIMEGTGSGLAPDGSLRVQLPDGRPAVHLHEAHSLVILD